MKVVTLSGLKTIANQLRACARTIVLALTLALGVVQTTLGQTSTVTNYAGLRDAIPQGGLIVFGTNVQVPITLAATFNIINNVTIDGTSNQVVLTANRVGRLFTVASNATLNLFNLQIEGGISTTGGAIYNQGTLTLSNCLVYSNTATNVNGVDGLNAATNGTQNGTSGTSGGSATGGAIYSVGSLNVYYTTFSNNVVTAGNGGNGGAGAPSDFLFGGNGGAGGNGGSASGGAITASGTSMFFATQFIMNQCLAGSGGTGGAGAAQTVSGNSGAGGTGGAATGGGLLVAGLVYMTNCLFYTNTVTAGASAAAKLLGNGTSDNGINGAGAAGGGAAILPATTAAYIENTTFFDNFCQGGAGGDTMDNPPRAAPGKGGSAVGGGLSTAALLTQLRCCTMATNFIIAGTNGVSTASPQNNSSGTVSGFDLARTGGTLRVSGSIFSGGTNAAPNYTPNCGGGLTDAGYNISSDASAAFTSSTSMPSIDPMLGAGLAPNGGSNIGPNSITVPTLTLEILDGSPAKGALLGIAGVTFPPTDETFVVRGNIADIGAFALTPVPTNTIVPPAIANQPPANQTNYTGSSAIISVRAQGDNLGYQWFKYTTNASQAPDIVAYVSTNEALWITKANIGGANSNALTFTNASPADSGAYMVLAANSLGVVASRVAVLTITARPPPPTVAITSPAASARVTNCLLSGTASSKAGIPAVYYWITNFNNGVSNATNGQAPVSGAGPDYNWTITTNVLPGTNVLTVQSALSGISSPLASSTFFYEVPATFTLTVANAAYGTVTGAASFSGDPVPRLGTNQLHIGEGYSLTATPNTTSLFAGWTLSSGGSSDTSTNSVLKFIMEPGLTVQAAFISNLFLDFAGSYNGLFYEANAVTEETAGMLSGLTLTKQGAYSGKVLLKGNSYTITGAFDLNRNANAIIPRSPQQGGPTTIAMTLSAPPLQILGQVSTGATTAGLIADLAIPTTGSSQYTMLLEPSAVRTSNSPPGDGYALITDQTGTVTLAGALADGTSFSQAVPSSQAGYVPLYASLYTNTGLLLGWINLSHLKSGASDSMAVGWIKKASPSTALYTNGFTNLLSVTGSGWTNPPAHTPALSLANGLLVVSNSSFNKAFNVAVSNNNSLATLPGSPTNTLSGSINAKGLLSVIFGTGNGRATTNGVGAVLQNQRIGGGFFLTPTNAGAITLSPTNGGLPDP